MTRRLIHTGTLLVGEDLEPVREATVVVEDGRISEIAGGFLHGQADRVLDYSRDVVLPGLIDTHVHLQLTPLADHEAVIATFREDQQEGRLPLWTMRHARRALAAGDTTVRDCGGDISILAVRDTLARGLPGPRLIADDNGRPRALVRIAR